MRSSPLEKLVARSSLPFRIYMLLNLRKTTTPPRRNYPFRQQSIEYLPFHQEDDVEIVEIQ